MTEQSLPDKSIHVGKTSEASRLDESLLNAVGLAVILTSPSGLITGFNRAAVTLLGFSREEVIGRTTPIIFHDKSELFKRAEEISKQSDTPPEVTFELIAHKAMHSKTPDRNEWTFLRKDGSRFHGSLTVVSVRDDDGNITGFALLITYLTTQLSLMEQVEISDEKFRLLAENIPGVIYLCHNDDNYSLIYINDGVFSLTGYPKEDFYAGTVSLASIIHPDDKQLIFETVNRCVAERKGYQLRYRIRHASGTERWVYESGIGLFEGDRLMMLEGFIQDITTQKDAEESVRKLAEENHRFFNSPVNLNAVIDSQGNLIRISPSWTNIIGWSEAELASTPFLDLIHPDDIQTAKEVLKHLSSDQHVHTFENRIICHDKSYRWLLWALALDPVSKLVYASAIDITERKNSEETILHSKSNLEGLTLHLQEQNRKLDEFAHIISHNLRAPVNNIHALINLLDDRSEISDYQLIFDKLKKVSKNLSETMNELLDTLKAKAETDGTMTEMRFKEVLDKVVQSLEGELIVAEASVTFDFNAAPTIRYSKPYLESIFQNLLTNAIKYRSADRKLCVHFRSFYTDDHLELEVTDNGQGIDMEKFGDKLFGLHKTFHQHQEARGVGLFLVKTQIEALGGNIFVRSEVDKGTTFTIRFS